MIAFCHFMKVNGHKSILFFLSVVFCGSITSADPGLVRIGAQANNQNVPKNIIDKSDAVLRLVTLDSEPMYVVGTKWFKYFEKVSPYRNQILSKLFHAEILRCEHNHLRQCPIYLRKEMASAFIGLKPNMIFTVRHIFDFELNKLVGTSGAELSFLLLDGNDNVIFDSRLGGYKARVKFIGNPARLLVGTEIKGFPLTDLASDFLAIELNKNVGTQALSFAPEKAPLQSSVYALGFATPTFNRENYGRSDAQGLGLYLAKGKVISPEQSFFRASRLVISNLQARALEQMLVFHDADTVGGQSGGPLLNENGEVIAIISSHYTARPTLLPNDDYSEDGGMGPASFWLMKFR